jgi:hypothetical protein
VLVLGADALEQAVLVVGAGFAERTDAVLPDVGAVAEDGDVLEQLRVLIFSNSVLLTISVLRPICSVTLSMWSRS